MLGKMLIHGLIAATLIGSAAAVYAQGKDNGYLPSTAKPAAVSGKLEAPPAGKEADGYVRPSRDDKRERSGKAERHHERHDRHHDEDDD
ncbi:MAG: hypothetical protein EPN20_12335 [Magnetospirillum sp.]|nr:MAG: hypothetical protein EPN20_12335 [Magnetospirillum sp.]